MGEELVGGPRLRNIQAGFRRLQVGRGVAVCRVCCLRQRRCVQIPGPWINIRKHRPRPSPHNRARRREKAERRSYHRIARLNPRRHQGQPECIRPRRAPHSRRRSSERCQLPLKCRNVLPANVVRGSADLLDRRQNFRSNPRVLACEIQHRHGFAPRFSGIALCNQSHEEGILTVSRPEYLASIRSFRMVINSLLAFPEAFSYGPPLLLPYS